MKKNSYPYMIVIMVICIAINYGGKMFAENYNLPVWLDMVGTILAAYYLGPICGATAGLTVNIMYGAISEVAYYYATTNMLVGLMAGILVKRLPFDKMMNAFSLSMITAFCACLVSVPLNYLLSDGYTGNIWGDAVINYLSEADLPKVICCILGEICLDIPNCMVSVFGVFFLVRFIRWRNRAVKAACVAALALFFACLPVNNAFAKDESENINSYIQVIYNSDDGILGGEVNDIAQTMDGMLWIGTYGGLYTYDGQNFTFMKDFDSIKNVNCMFTDEEGRLWIGTNDSGFAIVSGYEIVNTVDEYQGLSNDSVRSITKSSDGLYYVGTSSSLDVFELVDGCRKKATINEAQFVKKLCSDSKGHVCGITSDGKLLLLKDARLISVYDGKYTSAYFDADDKLYVTTDNEELIVYDMVGDEIVRQKDYGIEGFQSINDIIKTSDGYLIICGDSGIEYFDESGSFEVLSVSGFESSIDHVMVDYQGNIWFSSSRLGLLELQSSIFGEIYKNANLEGKVVNAIAYWNGNYFFGTDSGIDVMDGELDQWVYVGFCDKLIGARIRWLEVDKNNRLWVATSGEGVFVINPDESYQQITTNEGLASDKTRVLLELSDGRMAVATDGGLSLLKDLEVVRNITAADGLTVTRVLCMYEYGGRIYCGTDGGGLFVVDKTEVISTSTKRDGLTSNTILRILGTSNGTGMLLFTSNGIVYRNYEGKFTALKNFPYSNNFDGFVASDGSIWITSSAGLYVTDEQSLISGEPIEYVLLDSKKGLRQSLTANSKNYCIGRRVLLLCGDSGIVSIDMQDYANKKESYRMILDSIVIDGQKVSVDKEEDNLIARDAVKIEFSPKIINFSSSDPYISVWLEGFEEKPTIMRQSELESLVYTNLKSGKYVFHIAILDNNQENIQEKISYTFVKESRLYDNWWFPLYIFSIFGIVLAYLLWLIAGSQINKSLQIQKKELENLKLKQTADAAVAAGEAKDRFLALMSHDIRTPINAILGMDEMILRESTEPNVTEYASDIKDAGATLLSIVNSILDFSKIEQGKMEIIPAKYKTRELFNNLINIAQENAKAKGLEFIKDIDPTLPSELWGDDIRINQVITNLLSNAVKYTRQGHVKLTVKAKEKYENVVTIYCEISDTGIGIKEEDMVHLTESFKRLDEQKNRNIEGTGLGMSIVTSLLELMGSKLTVKSVYGEGSSFSFELTQKVMSDKPMGDVDRKKKVFASAEDHIKLPEARVLIVDDNNLNLVVLQKLLKVNEIKPDKATSGMEAIRLVGTREYDLILMDHMMPEMDGIEALAQMRSNELLAPKTKVIVLTANAINGAREQYMKAGFDDYLTKPVDVELLEKTLRKYLAGEDGGDES